MPRAAKTPKPDATKVYVAWQSFAADHPADTLVCQGDRLRGDHPAVVAHPWLFVLGWG
jgi:hypothetical protein